MIWDTNLPANLGYIASILWHQNNCIQEASPVTTMYELEAGSDLCEMLGLDRNESMGHLVTGGSVANIEAMWVARNLKFYPLGLQEAVKKEEKLQGAREYEVMLENKKPIACHFLRKLPPRLSNSGTKIFKLHYLLLFHFLYVKHF